MVKRLVAASFRGGANEDSGDHIQDETTEAQVLRLHFLRSKDEEVLLPAQDQTPARSAGMQPDTSGGGEIMQEVWIGNYAHRPFRVTVKLGKIVKVEGDLAWAKGMRIRHFKRTVWKYGGPNRVERERSTKDASRSIPVSPQDGETEKARSQEVSQEEIEAAPAEIERVFRGRHHNDKVSSLRTPPETRPSLPRVRRPRISSGMGLRRALRAAKIMGCEVDHIWGTGETRISHRLLLQEDGSRRTVVLNQRKKDAPRALTSFLTQLKAALPS